jgi:hypothetical protein
MTLIRVCGTTTTPDDIVFFESQFVQLKASKLQILAAEDDGEAGGSQNVTSGTLPPISVVWHVIYANETLEGGYLPDEQVDASVSSMNEHYKSVRLLLHPIMRSSLSLFLFTGH